MKKLRIILLLAFVAFLGKVGAQSQRQLAQLMLERNEYYFKLEVAQPSEIQIINRLCSVDATDGKNVICYANGKQYEAMLKAGYQPTLMTPPSLQQEADMWKGGDRATYEWDTYLTYSQYVSMMQSFPTSASSDRSCTLLDLGTLSTSNHRKILGVRINNGQPDGKPKFLYTSTMHGDEVTGMILMLRLIDELCTSTDTRIMNLIDNLDIFIFPLTNPDGTYYGGNNTVTGAIRYNGNWIDLNRHFPDFDDGPHPDGESSYQDEAQWMMDLAQEHLFTMAANYHGGAEVVNYPWDTYQPLHTDDAWWQYVSLKYAQAAQATNSSYMTSVSNNGIINGYAWYTITGSRQDYMNYYGQCRELTIECSNSKTPTASQLPNFWNYNHNSMLLFMEECLNGVHGFVYDLATKAPLPGVTVTVQNHDNLGSEVSSHALGDYHRPIKAGTYTFVFSKEGYESQSVQVTVTDGQRIDMDPIYMRAEGEEPEADALHWTPVQSSYADNMTMSAIIQIDGEEQFVNTLEVGVFVGEECRASEKAVLFPFNNRYILSLAIAGEEGESFSFRLYDHLTSNELTPELNAPSPVTFNVDGYGSPINPYVLNFTSSSSTTTTIELNAGWNWFSSYLVFDENTLQSIQEQITAAGANCLIKTQNLFTSNSGGIWLGSLIAMDNATTYMIQLDKPVTITLTGTPINTSTFAITIKPGWNWISFPVDHAVAVNTALSNITAVKGDMIKCQDSFSTFSNGMWLGSLQTLEPNTGYIFLSNHEESFQLIFAE